MPFNVYRGVEKRNFRGRQRHANPSTQREDGITFQSVPIERAHAEREDSGGIKHYDERSIITAILQGGIGLPATV